MDVFVDWESIVYHVSKGSSSNSIEKVEVEVDVGDFGPISISSSTKDSSLGRREMESAIALSVPFT